jgi:hypothetical protein
MLDRLLSIVVSITLGFLVWLYARSRDQDTLDNIPIPVQIALAPGQAAHYDLEVLGPTQIPVSFMGPPSRIREVRNRLQNGDLRATVTVSVPDDRLDESRYSETVRILSRHIHAPPGVKPTVVEGQNRIPVNLYRLVERRLPVRLEHTGEERVSNISIEPAAVLVRGPKELLDKLRVFPTRSYNVPDGDEPAPGPQMITTKPIPLEEKIEGRRVWTTPSMVTARLTVQPQRKLYHLDDVPVQFLCPPNFELRPLFGGERAGKITLRLRGPATDDVPVVTAYVDLSERRWSPGLYEERVKLHLPSGYQLIGEPPGPVSFELVSGLTNGRDGAVPQD